MASYPLQNYVGDNIPLWLPNDGTLSVSTIVTSTITTGELAVVPDSNMAYAVVGLEATSTIAAVSLIQPGYSALTEYVVANANGSTIVGAAAGITNANGSYSETFFTKDLAGNATTRGTIQIVSSLTGAGGGVQLTGQDSTYFRVGDQGTDIGLSNARLNTFFSPPNGLSLRHYTPDGLQSGINFNGGVGNYSSISLVAGNNPATSIYTGINGIGLAPGAGNPVTLTNGYVNFNNSALSNVSSINGAQQQPISYLDAYGGTSPIFSTIGGSAVAIPMIPFSTVAGKVYQVSVEFSATNGGGGGANDETMIGISNSNSSVGLYGRFIAVNTWKTDQTYDAYRNNVTAIFPCNSNNSGQSVLELLDVSNAGNVQIVTLEQLTVKDLGFPVNAF